MKRSLLIILVVSAIIHINGYTQPYNKAVITDLRYYLSVNTDAGINNRTFPFYFDSEKFNQKIHSVIEENLTVKYGVEKFEYRHGKNMNYQEGIQLERLHLKDDVDRSEKSTLYVAVVSSVYASMVINGVPRYVMLVKVKAVNHKKRKVYKFKCKQPFEIFQGEEITGIVMLGELDFQDMFLHTLDESLKGNHPILGSLDLNKPATLKYNEFLANSTRFLQTEKGKIISFIDDNDEGFDAIEYKGDFWRSYTNNTNIASEETGQLLWQNKVKRTYDLKNLILNEDYRVKIKGGDSEWFNFITFHEDVKVIFKNDTVNEGEFTYDPAGLLQGTFNGQKCGVEWIYENNVAEVFIDDDLIGLIQPLPDKKYIYFPNDLSDEDVGLLINLVFAFDYAQYVQDIIDANAGR
jgi:hypothetical protein